ncbi:MAG: LysR family transcriptional regulator [Rhizobiales bacterium]|nr:LysR family transcriptional regulator [Hyphomicrobiales bacterium]
MARDNLNDLFAFVAVARERSFTKAAAKLGVSQSALSHTIRDLEARLNIRLLTRTTRSVSPTEAGERLFREMSPQFDQISASLAGLDALRDKPSGTIRISTGIQAAETILWPAITRFVAAYPDVKIEIDVDAGFADIARLGYDAGVRLGEQVAKDMVAVRIGPDMRMAVVSSPAYFRKRPAPKAPSDLTLHDCINIRMQTHGGLLPWEFEKGKRRLNVRVEGRFTFSDASLCLNAAREGHGIAYLTEDRIGDDLKRGKLVRVLQDWCPEFSGYHLYYPSRRQSTRAFSLLIEALRHGGKARNMSSSARAFGATSKQ